MNKFEKSILTYIREKHMLETGDTVTAGVSGGADSVCLLTVLHRLRRVLKISLRVVHVDHMLRATAAEDAEFVRALCERLDVPFTLHRVDVAAYAKEKGLGLEEAGREVRYAAFQTHSRIATAHTATDQAETVLLNLFRGTGLRGAAGILPVNGNIIRPLLNTTREEIETYLRAEGIAWREDETNAEDDYVRNRVRHHILPVATREINARAVRHLAEAAETFAEADELIAGLAEKYDRGTGTVSYFSVSTLHALPPILQQESVRQALRSVTPHLKDISRRHIDAVLELCRNNHGVKTLDLPCGVKVVRDHDILTFTKTESDNS